MSLRVGILSCDLSGGGKSQAADIIEDLDYYCVDNMPVALIPKFAELCAATKGRYEKVALVTDIREKNGIKDIFNALETLREMDFGYKILFMEAKPSGIVKRYKESRRPHPLAARSRTRYSRRPSSCARYATLPIILSTPRT